MTIVKKIRKVVLGQSGGGGSGPALGHAGINIATQLATASTIIVDQRLDITTYSNITFVSTTYPTGTVGRAAAISYRAGGGYFGQGCMRGIPGWMYGDAGDPKGEHYCGIGQLLGWHGVAPGGNCDKVSVGILCRFGPTYWSAPPIVNHGKAMIILRDGVGGQNTRPMVISQGTSGSHGFGAGDGTVMNHNTDPEGTDYYNEEGGPCPNQLVMTQVWQWLQLEVDLTTPVGVGQSRVKIWSADGAYVGTPVIAKALHEDVGGGLPGADILLTFAGSCSDTEIDSGFWFESEYIEIWVGQSTGMTPPHGFPGSSR